MLTIRRAQREALAAPFWQQFAHAMVAHLVEFFPVDATLLGDAGLRQVVAEGIARARAHGLRTEGEVCRFIDLSLALGTAFDSDPLLPWAQGILARNEPAAARVGALHARALAHIGDVAGSDGRIALRAALRIRGAPYEELCSRGAATNDDLSGLLHRIHPARCAELARACSWPVFFAHLSQVATTLRLDAPGPRALCAILMCLLGGHFATDPQHPWVRPALEAASATDADTTARALWRDANGWLEQALPLMRRGAS